MANLKEHQAERVIEEAYTRDRLHMSLRAYLMGYLSEHELGAIVAGHLTDISFYLKYEKEPIALPMDDEALVS